MRFFSVVFTNQGVYKQAGVDLFLSLTCVFALDPVSGFLFMPPFQQCEGTLREGHPLFVIKQPGSSTVSCVRCVAVRCGTSE